MTRILHKAVPLAAAALLVAGSAFAGGASCGTSDAARMTSGSHCDGVKGGAAGASAMACPTVKAGQNIYSFAVPGAECGNCVKSIQTALMAQKGVTCAHVDLNSHTAYVIADRSFDKNAIAKCIQTAGFKNRYKGQGAKVQAEFAKAMAAGSEKPAACSTKEGAKEKDKI